jgi:prephenate dehydratase
MVRVAFQGEHGAYSELAAELLWPGSARLPFRENDDVVRAVARHEADTGVLAIENSLAGSVTATIDALFDADDVHVVCEAVVPINHCLLGLPGTSLEDIRSVESHPIALAQCRSFLDRHPGLEPRSVYDTAGAARDIAGAGDPRRAALAGVAAAERYGLSILERNVEDRPDNRTRFIGVSRTPSAPPPGTRCKTTLAITTENYAGALLRLMTAIADAGLNVARIDTRPTGHPWTYRFILDVLHRCDDARLSGAIGILRLCSRSCRVLGTFPVAAEEC